MGRGAAAAGPSEAAGRPGLASAGAAGEMSEERPGPGAAAATALLAGGAPSAAALPPAPIAPPSHCCASTEADGVPCCGWPGAVAGAAGSGWGASCAAAGAGAAADVAGSEGCGADEAGGCCGAGAPPAGAAWLLPGGSCAAAGGCGCCPGCCCDDDGALLITAAGWPAGGGGCAGGADAGGGGAAAGPALARTACPGMPAPASGTLCQQLPRPCVTCMRCCTKTSANAPSCTSSCKLLQPPSALARLCGGKQTHAGHPAARLCNQDKGLMGIQQWCAWATWQELEVVQGVAREGPGQVGLQHDARGPAEALGLQDRLRDVPEHGHLHRRACAVHGG